MQEAAKFQMVHVLDSDWWTHGILGVGLPEDSWGQNLQIREWGS